MKITFKDEKLELQANDDKKLKKEFGKIMAAKIKQRLDDIRAAETLEDLRYMPGKFHELTSTRKGQFACHLEEPMRLVFVPHEKPIPVNKDGQYVWADIKGVEIIQIINYHKEK